MLSCRRVRGRHLAHHREIIYRAGAVAIERKYRPFYGGFFSRVIKAADAAGGYFRFTDKMRRGRAVGSHYYGASTNGLATRQRDLVFVKGIHAGVQANSLWSDFFRQLQWNGLHPARRHAGVSFRQHLEHEFKHAAGGFQLTIEENATEKG